MKIITGYTGEPHVKSDHDRAVHRGIVGEGAYILNTGNKLVAEVISANEIRIRDGVLSYQGCCGIVENGTYDTLAIANGTQGMKRKDLIVCRYEKTSGTNVESMALVVIQGTPAASNPAVPAYNEGLIADGDSPVDCPLYVVNLDGIAITSVDALVDVMTTTDRIEALESSVTEIQGQIPTFVTEDFVEAGVTIGANAARSYTKSIAKTGYTPVAICGIWIENGTGGRNGGWVLAQNWYINKITVNNVQVDGALFTLWNQNTAQQAIVQLSFKVLYISNNAI